MKRIKRRFVVLGDDSRPAGFGVFRLLLAPQDKDKPVLLGDKLTLLLQAFGVPSSKARVAPRRGLRGWDCLKLCQGVMMREPITLIREQ